MIERRIRYEWPMIPYGKILRKKYGTKFSFRSRFNYEEKIEFYFKILSRIDLKSLYDLNFT